MIDTIFQLALFAAFALTMWATYETVARPKPHKRYHMVDQAKRWGHK